LVAAVKHFSLGASPLFLLRRREAHVHCGIGAKNFSQKVLVAILVEDQFAASRFVTVLSKRAQCGDVLVVVLNLDYAG